MTCKSKNIPLPDIFVQSMRQKKCYTNIFLVPMTVLHSITVNLTYDPNFLSSISLPSMRKKTVIAQNVFK